MALRFDKLTRPAIRKLQVYQQITEHGITAERLFSLNLIDNVIREPLGGAHRDYDQIAATLKDNLLEGIDALESVSIDKLLDQRYQKLMAFGQYREG